MTPDLTVVVPTYNERGNVEAVVARLDAALAGISWQAVFVDDDSPDGTAALIDEIADKDPRVSCLLRIGRRGLASACIEGMAAAKSPYIAVMDADLQHDEAVLPEMLSALRDGGKELAIASRYRDGGGTGEWGRGRVIASRVATLLSRRLIPAGVTDPMSGFFMIRRETFEGVVRRLSGKGFKILLDILASAEAPLDLAEVPFTFRPRAEGESKLDSRVVWEFLELLIDKSLGRVMPVRFVLFVLVGGTGVVVHLAVLGLFHQVLALSFDVAQGIAVLVAMTSNFFLNNRVTYRDKPLAGARLVTGLLTFYAACALGAVVNFAVAVFLADRGAYWALAGIAGAVAGAVWNFATTAIVTWRGTDDPGTRA